MIDNTKQKEECEQRMIRSLEFLGREFSGVRTSRVSPTLLDSIKVSVYGSLMPLQQLGTVNAPEPRLLTIQVWDKSHVKTVEKAINESDLGLNSSSDGTLIRIPIPPLTEERRKELSKLVSKYAEETRVNIRGIRRDTIDKFKKLQKDKLISEDDLHRLSEEIQKLTDTYIKKIDGMLEQKQKDVMHV